MQRPRTPDAFDEKALALWYGLGRAYSEAAGGGERAWKLGFTVVCVVGALVLLSGWFFGTGWAGPFAPAFPVAAGLISGGGLYLWGLLRSRKRIEALRRGLTEDGLDPRRPARDGLGAYHDAHLVLLRSEYEYLRLRRANMTARIFEESFGFTPEDPFETGPLNVAPDTEGMRRLRERWERRLAMRRVRGMEAPALGSREDRAYCVFPREVTAPAEISMREAYLTVSCDLLRHRYGRNPVQGADHDEELRARIERDLAEHAALTRNRNFSRRVTRRARPGPR